MYLIINTLISKSEQLLKQDEGIKYIRQMQKMPGESIDVKNSVIW